MKAVDRENSLTILELIDEFTQAEVSAITIHHPNPDFGGHDHAISYSWLDFTPPVIETTQETVEEMFYGDSILECLQALRKTSRNPDIRNLSR